MQRFYNELAASALICFYEYPDTRYEESPTPI